MFVFVPSQETYEQLLDFAKTKGSFDGGDQGLLNSFFPNWHRLSFVYNMVATACYTYLPAFKEFGRNVKLVHFLGSTKPWHGESAAQPGSAYGSFVGAWWTIYRELVRPSMPQSVSLVALWRVWLCVASVVAKRAVMLPYDRRLLATTLGTDWRFALFKRDYLYSRCTHATDYPIPTPNCSIYVAPNMFTATVQLRAYLHSFRSLLDFTDVRHQIMKFINVVDALSFLDQFRRINYFLQTSNFRNIKSASPPSSVFWMSLNPCFLLTLH
ncbi:hypothetical protein HAZT_HAZT003187 [Hyalella azteca]|uniref:glycogenin glucosyltransferase n=1 Tax=Hyalella azteca TaxID=294128 RepID=A0A6A0H8L5_HYAAZ|nr:hypothetical protein HAZT_HAZT003187 [Hyalella azteca]